MLLKPSPHTVAMIIGATVGGVIWYGGYKSHHKLKKLAGRDRAAWARKWNKKLMEKT